jgi:hypothetical protein
MRLMAIRGICGKKSPIQGKELRNDSDFMDASLQVRAERIDSVWYQGGEKKYPQD